jgi:hypothetical protein
MTTYTVGARVFCDFAFGGKPKGIVREIIKPGDGKQNAGEVLVELLETVGAYRKGEKLKLSTYYAVPLKQESPSQAGQYFRRISTLYRFE